MEAVKRAKGRSREMRLRRRRERLRESAAIVIVVAAFLQSGLRSSQCHARNHSSVFTFDRSFSVFSCPSCSSKDDANVAAMCAVMMMIIIIIVVVAVRLTFS